MTKQIYFYSDPARYEDQLALGKTPMLKIGDTTQETVDERIKQQDTTSSAQVLEKKGSYFTEFGDKEFHKHLESRGYKKTRKEREWFYITVEDAERELLSYRDGGIKVEKYFQPRPHQAWVNQEVMGRFDGSETIIQPLNLCARFGKDLQKMSLFRDTGLQVMISAGYWLGANQSTINTINQKWDITSDIQVIKPVYSEFVTAIQKGRVMIDLSLHTDTDKLDSELIVALGEYQKFIYVDEADFGAWKPSQREKLNLFIESGINLVCLATGTNIDRALIGSGDVQEPITVSYLDLLEGKRGEGYLFEPGGFCSDEPQKWMDTLSDIVDISVLNLDVADELAGELNELSDEERPNMAKIFHLRNSHIQKQIVTKLLADEDTNEDIFGLYNTMYGDIDHPAVMMFIPGKIADINNFVKVGKRLVPDYNWVALNSDKYTNRESETMIKDIIKNGGGERTVIVSSSMGSRSFSVPNIVAVINCKDGGSMGTAVQQASRCFTPGCDKEMGMVVNYSFNTEKTSNFESDLISTAINYSDTDTESSIRRVWGLVNFLKRDSVDRGYLLTISQGEFIDYVTSDVNLNNMAKATVDMSSLLTDLELNQLLQSVISHPSTNKEWKGKIEKAITFIDDGVKNDKVVDEEEKEQKKAIRDLIQKINSIIDSTGNVWALAPYQTNYIDCLTTVSEDEDKDAEFVSIVGISSSVVLSSIVKYLPIKNMDMIITRNREMGEANNFQFLTSAHPAGLFDI